MSSISGFINELFLDNGIIISVAAYVIVKILKRLKVMDNKWMPLIAGALGLILGVAFGATGNTILPDTSLITCAIKGLALGWAPVGGGEAFRQIKDSKAATATATAVAQTEHETVAATAQTASDGQEKQNIPGDGKGQ